jgi:hypothetical protein
MSVLRTSLATVCAILPLTLPAQNPPPAPAGPRDAIRNGGFERTTATPNLWSGVDKDGFLAGFAGSLPVLDENGSIANTAMPVAVAVGDLNGDGRPDILSSDPLGYLRIYYNSGSKEQPKFTSGELTLPWLASGEGDPPWQPVGLHGGETLSWNLRWANRRLGGRASLADLSRSGKLDLVAGNYFGDLFVIRNSGSADSPVFAQPKSIAKAVIPTTEDPLRRWGNVFAPLLHDWDGDGKPDLLVGEGSYSANNVHLFLNQGSAAAPVFNEEKRQPLALGEGRQQLTPALADVNGNGRLDILVSDRNGRVTAYLRPDQWKFGDSISPSGYVSKNGGLTPDEGQALVLGPGIHTIATGDLNGDGLFDLVVGRPNGRIAWAPNQGTKDAPKFAAPQDLTGDKPVPLTRQWPADWEIDTGVARGNILSYADAVSAQDDPESSPPEGSRTLKFGFATGAADALARFSLPGAKNFRLGEHRYGAGGHQLPLSLRILGAPSRTFIMQQNVELQVGQKYTLSIRHRGSGVVGAHVFLGWFGLKDRSEPRRVRGERGAVRIIYDRISESGSLAKEFRPGSSWASFNEKASITFKNRELNDLGKTSHAVLIIAFELGAPDGFLYLDDIKLVPQG